MTGSVGLAIEGTVALLLVITIGYCILLNRKLGALRRDEGAMRALVRELTEATATAERAIQSLKTSAADWDRALGSRMRHAERINDQLGGHVDRAEPLAAELTDIVDAAKRESNRLVRLVAREEASAAERRHQTASQAPVETATEDHAAPPTSDVSTKTPRPARAVTPARQPAQSRTRSPAPAADRAVTETRVEPTPLEREAARELESRIQAQMRKSRKAEERAPETPSRYANDDRKHDDALTDGTVAGRRARLRRNLERRAAG